MWPGLRRRPLRVQLPTGPRSDHLLGAAEHVLGAMKTMEQNTKTGKAEADDADHDLLFPPRSTILSEVCINIARLRQFMKPRYVEQAVKAMRAMKAMKTMKAMKAMKTMKAMKARKKVSTSQVMTPCYITYVITYYNTYSKFMACGI